ncbi:hypothetical protein VUJ46_07305 [Chryseobacterium sp. MYb264]|uniref:hypothetical protein n=1 Tax=Chryseobacterium sp. MYb264 TaxID=2745153 RepID=UPI002E0F84C2|nr:hypothetical protein VUJ46_07305 [Chryseobacterium sp. MYb264]
MIAAEYFNNHITVEGEIIVKKVPNDSGSVLVWNPSTNKISQRTKEEIIADLDVMTLSTGQFVYGQKSFMSVGSSDEFANKLWVRGDNNSEPGITFWKTGYISSTLTLRNDGFHFGVGASNHYDHVKAAGFRKNGSSDNLFLTGGGGDYDARKKEDSYIHSSRNFEEGTFIETDVDYSATNGDQFLLEMKGNMYGSGNYLPLDLKLQGYIYNGTIISEGGYSTLFYFNYIIALNFNGKLAFWFPRLGYWQGFDVKLTVGYGGLDQGKNRVTAISDYADPGGTKRVQINLKHLLTKEELISENAFWEKKNVGGAYWGLESDREIGIFTPGMSAQRILSGGLLTSDHYYDKNYIPPNGIHAKGFVQSDEGFQNRYWKADQRNRIWSFANSENHGMSYYQGGFHPSGEGIGFHFGDGNDYKFFIKNDGSTIARQVMTVNSPDSIGSGNAGTTGTHYKLLLGNSNDANSPNYGMAFWVEGSGEAYIQQQRFDGNNVAYRLNLQPYGGDVTINNNTVWHNGNFNPNTKVTNSDNVVGLAFDSGSASRTPYFIHTNGTYVPIATHDFLAQNYALRAGSNASGAWENASRALVTNPYIPGRTLNSAGDVYLQEATYGDVHGILNSSGKSQGNPTEHWYHRIKMLHSNSAGYYTEIAVQMTGNNSLHYRKMEGGKVSDWIQVWDQANFAPETKINAWQGAQSLGFSGGNIDDTPYIYTTSGQYRFLATQNWSAGKFVNLDSQQDITGLKVIKGRSKNTGTGWGNTATATDYSFLVETGSGSDFTNQYTASIGFFSNSGTQAGIYARSNDIDGTSMAFATTNSFGTGPQIALTINNEGTVNHLRSRPTFKGNVIWDEGNLTPSMINNWNSMSSNGIVVNQIFTNNTNNRLIIVDEYFGEDSGIYDENNEFYLAALQEEYYKYSSRFKSWEGINFHIKSQNIGVGTTANDADKINVSGSVKATKNFKSEEEKPNTLFIPDGNLAFLDDEITNEEYRMRLSHRMIEQQPGVYDYNSDNRMLVIRCTDPGTPFLLRRCFKGQRILVLNANDSYAQEFAIRSAGFSYKIQPFTSIQLFVWDDSTVYKYAENKMY